jgi:hypothetical protein
MQQHWALDKALSTTRKATTNLENGLTRNLTKKGGGESNPDCQICYTVLPITFNNSILFLISN